MIEYSDNCLKTSGSLWQYYKDEPNDNLTDSESFKSKIKIAGNKPADDKTRIFAITVAKLYVPVVTLSTQDNAKLFQQSKSGFKRTINWYKYQSDPKSYAQSRYLNHLVDPNFQGVNKLFVLSFENENGRTSHSENYLPKVEIKGFHVKIDGKNFFDQPINNDIKAYGNIRKIATGQWLLFVNYYYFEENYKMIATDLNKQQALDADPRAIQQINFTAKLGKPENITIFFYYWRSKRNCLILFTRNCKSILNVL